MRRLLIGDPHVQLSDLDDAAKMLGKALEIAKQKNIQTIEIFGDLFHNHAVVRIEVIAFWQHWLKKLSEASRVIVLSGNHDQVQEFSKEWEITSLNSLKNLSENVVIVNSTHEEGGTLYVAYTHSEEKFRSAVQNTSSKRLVCHQTFDGAQFENGFYAPEGFKMDCLSKFDRVLSGHIHKSQDIGKVKYIGTPRWLSLSDANQDKGFLIEEEDGAFEFVSNSDVCRVFVALTFNEGDEIKLPDLPNAKIFVELVGSSKWIKKVSDKVVNARIVPRPTDSVSQRSGGRVFTSLEEYITKNFKENPEKVIRFIHSL
jgi:DNA repair exonuclease SbcCD nuclease subunit